MIVSINIILNEIGYVWGKVEYNPIITDNDDWIGCFWLYNIDGEILYFNRANYNLLLEYTRKTFKETQND